MKYVRAEETYNRTNIICECWPFIPPFPQSEEDYSWEYLFSTQSPGWAPGIVAVLQAGETFENFRQRVGPTWALMGLFEELYERVQAQMMAAGIPIK